jgi:hypothetical protein
MPPELADEVHRFIYRCTQYPDLARAVLRENDTVWRIVLKGALDTQQADLLVDSMARESDRGWPVWQVGLVVAGVGIGALAVGLVVGFLGGLFS